MKCIRLQIWKSEKYSDVRKYELRVLRLQILEPAALVKHCVYHATLATINHNLFRVYEEMEPFSSNQSHI